MEEGWEQSQQVPQPPVARTPGKRMVIACLAVVALVVIGGVGYVLLSGPETPNHSDPFTAKQGLAFAEKEAKAWNSGAKLAGIWTYEGPTPPNKIAIDNSLDKVKGDGMSAFWVYDYNYGTEWVDLTSAAIILKADGSVELKERKVFHKEPIGAWSMDSDEAVRRTLDSGDSFSDEVLEWSNITVKYQLSLWHINPEDIYKTQWKIEIRNQDTGRQLLFNTIEAK